MEKSELKKIEYQSWQNGNKWTEEEIDFIIQHECSCDNCGESVDKLSDFPEIDMELEELLCEDCYDELHRTFCPVCENSYDIKEGESDYSVLTEYDANQEGELAGIYHLGKFLIPLNINELKKIDCGDGCSEVYSDKICPDCVSELVKKEGYLKTRGVGIPCILIKGYRETLFKEWTDEHFKLAKHSVVHKRITIRGIIQKANN